MTYIEPLTPALLIAIVAGLFLWRRNQRPYVPMLAAILALMAAWPPVDWLASLPLEAGYSRDPMPSQPADAIVVLSSSVRSAVRERPYPLPDSGTYERCRFAAWLHGHWRRVPVLACGGPETTGGEPFAATMREVLAQAGVADDMIWTEERSRSTHENAVFGAEILKARGVRRIALVVDAKSMPRAERCFSRLGISVQPAPSSFRDLGPFLTELIPSARALRRNEVTLHEYVGFAWYKLRGWI